MKDPLNPPLLISEIDHSLVLPLATVKDFRGKEMVLVAAEYSAPPSTGRIYVAEKGVKNARTESYCPSVCNLRWKDADSWKQMLIDDGCPEEEAEGMVAEAIAALTRKPYK